MAAAGIDSFKIEGRNKKAFYVASVVRAYRLALDGVPSSELADELLAVSHRPYGTGFYYGDARQSPTWTATPPNAGMPPRWKRANRPAKARSA